MSSRQAHRARAGLIGRAAVRSLCEHAFVSTYVELHAHSAFSFLDGTAQPEELVVAALERGHTAMALTDHDTVSGSMEFAQAAGALGLRAIHGTELSVRDEEALASPEQEPDASGTALRVGVWAPPALRHVTLLVRDATGWRNLCRLLTRAHAHTRDATRRRAIAPSVTIADVAEHAEGLVCLSGCARQGVEDEPSLRRLLAAFGPEGLRIELQRPFARHDRARNRSRLETARRLGVACVATGNVHACNRSRALLQDAFVAIREHATLDSSEPVRRGNHAHVLAAPAAMGARFADHPEAVAESARLADELRFDLTADLGYRYPGSEDDGAGRTLRETCHAAFDTRYPPGHKRRTEAVARLEEELGLIDRLGLSGFFVLHHELLELAREIAVEVRGRGTARSLLPPGRGPG
jgi:error-prone DNA polymerase